MALRMNISAPVRSSDSAKLSKHATSLVDCTRKKNFFLGVRLAVSDIISGGLLGHLGPHKKLAHPRQKFFFECNLLDWPIRLSR